MITKTINLYEFDELSKEAQQKAIKYFRDTEEYIFLSDDMQYRLDELIPENGIIGKAKVFYSLSYSQGDGAMFEGNFTWGTWTVKIKHSGRYYHYNSKEIEIYQSDDDCVIAEKYTWEKFNDLYVDICKELARYGYDVMESATSDENIIENIKANGYTFTEKGVLENL